MIHRVHDSFPARFARARIRHVGRVACVTCAVAATASPVRSEVLADFDGSGFDFLFDNFQQTISPTTVRLAGHAERLGRRRPQLGAAA